jgi:hypothetical protein
MPGKIKQPYPALAQLATEGVDSLTGGAEVDITQQGDLKLQLLQHRSHVAGIVDRIAQDTDLPIGCIPNHQGRAALWRCQDGDAEHKEADNG